MAWFNWRRAAEAGAADRQAREWRAAWSAAVRARDGSALAGLAHALDERRMQGEDVELEEEMIGGARQAFALAERIAAGELPAIETTHRVVGGDACHFSAPASILDDPAEASGRLLLTGSRAIFVGGPKLVQIAWHAVRDAQAAERDLVLIRGADNPVRFRCNTYGDALGGAAVAAHLAARARRI